MQDEAHVANELEAFIRDHFQIPDDDDLFTREVNLWEEGYVDSMGVVEVLAFLEDHFAVEIPKELLFDPSFTTVEGIARLIASLRGGAEARTG